MAYGPDNDCLVDDAKTTSVAVSPGFGAYLRFSSPAALPSTAASPAASAPPASKGVAERAVCIYRTDQGAVKLAERHLTGASFEPWGSGRNHGEGPVIYVITAWRKKAQPDGGGAWRQMTVRSVLNSRHDTGAPALAPGEQDSEDVVVVSVDVTPQT